MSFDYMSRGEQLRDEIITNRRTIHGYAETGFDLEKTVTYVMEQLSSYGYRPRRVGKAGVTCTVGKEGKVFLLRGDMDALPMAEETGLPFAANNGNCHSCGHDCHAAMLLGAAKMLKEREDQLEGTVKFMFQPAEELLGGAVDMVQAGILENPKVDAGMAMHVMVGNENSKTGEVFYANGPANFSGDAVTIRVKGRTAHGSTPEIGVDAISIAAHIVIALQEILAREINSMQPAVLIVGTIHGGTTCNTLAGEAVLECSCRAATHETRAFLKRRIKEIAEGVAGTFRGEAEVEYVYGMPPMVNDRELSDEIGGYCGELLSPERVHVIPVSNGTEDFTAVAARIPTTFLNLGAGSREQGHQFSMHHPKMVVDEDALPIGAALYAFTAEQYLSNHKDKE